MVSGRPPRPKTPLITLIVPVFNEEDAIASFLEAAFEATRDADFRTEILFVDDGSTDGTALRIGQVVGRGEPVRLIRLARNFGKEAALTAGLDHAAGDAVIPMDVDLQDPPELIARMVATWREGYDVVQARRVSRDGDTFLKRVSANGFYGLFNLMASAPMAANVGDFRLLDRRVVEALGRYREKGRFMKGLFSAVGFSTATIDYARPARRSGRSKWSYWRLWNFALDGLFSFSTVPLRVWTYVGTTIAGLSFCYALYIVALALVLGISVPGYASLMTAVLFMGGVQLISLGIIGEYIGRMFIETKNRPIYIVRETFNLGPDAAAGRRSRAHGS